MEGMAIGLLSRFLGGLFIVIAIGLIIFASLTRRAGRGYVTSVLALVVAVASVGAALPV
jgi:hypothetical protein